MCLVLVRLFVCPSVRLFYNVCLFVCVFVCLFLCVCLFACLFVCVCVCVLFACLCVFCLFVCACMHLFVFCVCACLFVCLFSRLFGRFSVCPHLRSITCLFGCASVFVCVAVS